MGGRQNGMRYLISSSSRRAPALRQWILKRSFLNDERPSQRLRHGERGRARNTLYNVSIASEACPLIMKVSAISPRYTWRRRVELHIQHWFKDYNLNAFRACVALHAGIAEIVEPVAYWSYRTGLAQRKSYFLYRAEKIDCSLVQLNKKLRGRRDCCEELAKKWIALLGRIHETAWRHNDINAKNVGLQFQNRKPSAISAKDIRDAQLHLFDYDKSQPIRFSKPRWLRLFFDARCVRYVAVPGVSQDAITQLYLRQRRQHAKPWQKTMAHAAVSFWRKGGFSLACHLGLRGRQKGRHLR